MLTAIENFLFRDGTTHAVVEFSLADKKMTITVAPWADLTATAVARFGEVKITSVDASYADSDDCNLPWDIIGFDCTERADGMWDFVLHTDGIEYCFRARWPQIIER